MLMALLGEMHFIPSGPHSSFNLPRGNGVAYAAQESWVQNETIKVMYRQARCRGNMLTSYHRKTSSSVRLSMKHGTRKACYMFYLECITGHCSQRKSHISVRPVA
jgi:hypothetical protein